MPASPVESQTHEGRLTDVRLVVVVVVFVVATDGRVVGVVGDVEIAALVQTGQHVFVSILADATEIFLHPF